MSYMMLKYLRDILNKLAIRIAGRFSTPLHFFGIIQSFLFFLVISLNLSGCASSSGVKSAGDNRYWVKGSSEFGLQGAKDAALKDAAKLCGSSKEVNRISSSNDSHVDFFGDRVQTWELEFSCGYSSNNSNSSSGSNSSYNHQQTQTQHRDIQRERQIKEVKHAYDICTLPNNERTIIAACSKAMLLDPNGAILKSAARIDLFYNRALAYARLKDYDRAIADIHWVLGAAPNDHQARQMLANLKSDKARARQATAPRNQNRTSHKNKRWEIVLSGINSNTVLVNGRQIFKQKKGSNRINIGQFFKKGSNFIEIWRQHFGKIKGQRAIIKRGGKVVLTLLPKDLRPLAMSFGGKLSLVQIQIQPQNGSCWINRGWGVIHGSVKIGHKTVDISGWEPCEQYRYLPQTPITAHGMPGSGTKAKILKALYAKVFKK